jgi:hypothetical protein
MSASDIILEVISALTEVGVTVSFSVQTETYDPASLGVTISGATSLDVLCSPLLNRKLYVEGMESTLVEESYILAAPTDGFDPIIGMEFTLDSTVYTISKVTKHSFNNTVVAYELSVC